jgi:FG-GAP repeat
MRRIFTAALLLVLLVPIASAQAGKSDRLTRDAKRARTIDAFRSSPTGQQTLAGSRGTLRAAGDFDHDGRQDVVVAVPGEDAGIGAIHIFYGGANGLKTSNDQIIRENDFCGGAAPGPANFGAAIAVGDFNGDGESDIAVGAPNYDYFVADAGIVLLFYGNQGGPITPADDCQYIGEDAIAAADGFEANDHFGSTLVAGKFGGSSHTDLAIGISDEDVGALGDAGAVATIYGSPGGLTFPAGSGSDGQPQNTTTDPQFFTQSALEGVPEAGDSFGQALDAGNLGRSTHADLVIGVPGEDVGETADAGAVNVVYGSSDGLTNLKDQIWTQDSEGVKDTAEENDQFGSSLAIGNFGKGGTNDLAVGVIFEDGAHAFVPGAVAVLYGSSGGIRSQGNQLWSQDSPGIPDSGEVLDLWGNSLAAGNVGKSGEADLIVGAPLETPGNTNFGSLCPGPRGCAGQVTVIYGSSGGLTSNGAKAINQNSSGVPDTAEAGDEFGVVVAAGNYGKSALADVVVGVPFEDIGAINSAGAIDALFGSTTGLPGTGAQFFSQDTPGVEDIAEAGDVFGLSLG